MAQQQVKVFSDHYAGFRRHLKLAAAVFMAIMVFGIGFALFLPNTYKSESFILIEAPEIPESIIRTTVTVTTGPQLATLGEKILTVSNLVEIIEEYGLYQAQRASTPVELLAMEMRKGIAIEPEQRNSISVSGIPNTRVVGFSISFVDEDPEIAKLVVDEITNKFLEENIKVRSQQTSNTNDFLVGEIARLEVEISELEGRLAEFKEVNAERLPSLNALNMNMMNRMDASIMTIETQLSSIEQNRISIEAQLATIEPTSAARLPDGSLTMSPADQLKALQTQLSMYENRYSDDHPDVIATKRDIESIRERFGIDANLIEIDKSITNAQTELAIAENKYSQDHPDVVQARNTIENLKAERTDIESRQLDAQIAPDNPVYIQLETSLATLTAEEVALKEEQAELRSRMKDYERRLMETPQIEKQLASLSRELNSTSSRYWVLRDKQFAAEMGEILEVGSKGESMKLIEPARVPLTPVKPNRPAIVLLTFLFALVAGVGVTQLVDGLDKAIYKATSIISVQGTAPLIEIPYIYTEDDLGQALKMRKMMFASLPAMLLLSMVILHFTFRPLDVLFYAVLARLGF
jgi:succinoglycan biosynthesis transport protein ExoP